MKKGIGHFFFIPNIINKAKVHETKFLHKESPTKCFKKVAYRRFSCLRLLLARKGIFYDQTNGTPSQSVGDCISTIEVKINKSHVRSAYVCKESDSGIGILIK